MHQSRGLEQALFRGMSPHIQQNNTVDLPTSLSLSNVASLSCEGKVRYTSIIQCFQALATAFKRSGNVIHKDIKDEVVSWIHAELVTRSILSTLSRPKYICQDIGLLTLTLFTREYMSTFATSRDCLQTAALLVLALDCSGRISEFLGTALEPDACLRWRHVAFYAVRLDDGTITIRATVRFEDLKDPSDAPEGMHKTIPLRLLPLSLAHQDSLRQLLAIALIDNVLEGIRSWSDLSHLDPGPNGSRMNVTAAALELPVSKQHC